MSEEWKKLYGEVVWAKSGTFPWWPSYVFDPDLILPTEKDREARDKGKKLVGKQYVVLFYADNTFGFMPAKNIKPYDCPDKDNMKKQKIGKHYQENFAKAMQSAEDELLLEPSKRLRWYLAFSEIFEDNEEDEGEEEEAGEINDSDEDSVEKTAVTKQKRGRKSLPSKEELSEEEEEPEQQEEEQSVASLASSKDSGDDSDIPVVSRKRLSQTKTATGKKRGRKPKNSILTSDDEEEDNKTGSGAEDEKQAKAKKPRKSLEKTPKETVPMKKATSEISSSAEKKGRGRPPKLANPNPKPTSLTKLSPSTTTPTPVAQTNNGKTNNNNAKILPKIGEFLDEQMKQENIDIDRVLQVLRKLLTMNITLDDLKISGLGKKMYVLEKKNPIEQIKVAAAEVVAKWRVLLEESKRTQQQTATTETNSPTPTEGANNQNQIPEEILSHPLRLRAFKLLYSILQEVALTKDFEHLLFVTYLSDATTPNPVNYLQSTTRFYALLKEKSSSAVSWLREQLQSDTNHQFVSNTFTLLSIS